MNFIRLENSLIVTLNGKRLIVSTDDKRFSKALEAVKNDDQATIQKMINGESFEGIKGLEIVNGTPHVNGKQVESDLAGRLMQMISEGLPLDPLVNFITKLDNNTSFRTRKELFKFLSYAGHSLTKDGNFIAYKKVGDDLLDLHTGTIKNEVGAMIEMDRSQVDDDPNNTCSHGLHVGAWDYVKGFKNGTILEVEVNPEDVVTIPYDYDSQKMRVCKYKVLTATEAPRSEIVIDDDEDLESDYSDDQEFYNEEDDDFNFWG